MSKAVRKKAQKHNHGLESKQIFKLNRWLAIEF